MEAACTKEKVKEFRRLVVGKEMADGESQRNSFMGVATEIS
jgi:hypothetical protein